jgi:hypothetical protein
MFRRLVKWQIFVLFSSRKTVLGMAGKRCPLMVQPSGRCAFLTGVKSGAFNMNQYVSRRLDSCADMPAAQEPQYWQPSSRDAPKISRRHKNRPQARQNVFRDPSGSVDKTRLNVRQIFLFSAPSFPRTPTIGYSFKQLRHP